MLHQVQALVGKVPRKSLQEGEVHRALIFVRNESGRFGMGQFPFGLQGNYGTARFAAGVRWRGLEPQIANPVFQSFCLLLEV